MRNGPESCTDWPVKYPWSLLPRQGLHPFVPTGKDWLKNPPRGPNGGYLAAVILRALTATVDDEHRTPRSLTVHYLNPAGDGDVEIETRQERVGRSG